MHHCIYFCATFEILGSTDLLRQASLYSVEDELIVTIA